MSATSISTAKENSIAPAITEGANLQTAYFVMPGSLQPWKPTIMSYTASLVTIFSGYPLDTLKTRMQTHKFNSTFDCFKQTLKHEGVTGLFRGITSPLISASLSKSLGVSLYTYLKPRVAEFQGMFYSPISQNKYIQNEDVLLVMNNFPVAVVSGTMAGAMVSLYACPFEFTKIFSQISRIIGNKQKVQAQVPKNIFQVFREIVKYEGFRGLYSGYGFHLLRDSVSNGLFFAVYETAKISIRSLSAKDGENGVASNQLSIVLAGGAAGMFSWLTVFPIDTVKSMAQRDIVTNILRARDGLERIPVQKRRLGLPTRRMYRGLGPSITRSVVTTMIFFSVYEYLMSHIA